MFLHHPDGHILIDGVQLSVAEFQEYEPLYTGPPDGFAGRLYHPDVRHVLLDGQHDQGAALPWPEGDRYLSKAAIYRTRHAQRQTPSAPPQGRRPGQVTANIWPDVRTRLTAAPSRVEEMGYFGNIWVRQHQFDKAGDVHEGHEHQFDHVSFLTHGSADVQVGDTVTSFTAPAWITIRAKDRHCITATSDRTVWWCVFALRDLDGSVVEIFDPARHSPYGNT